MLLYATRSQVLTLNFLLSAGDGSYDRPEILLVGAHVFRQMITTHELLITLVALELLFSCRQKTPRDSSNA